MPVSSNGSIGCRARRRWAAPMAAGLLAAAVSLSGCGGRVDARQATGTATRAGSTVLGTYMQGVEAVGDFAGDLGGRSTRATFPPSKRRPAPR